MKANEFKNWLKGFLKNKEQLTQKDLDTLNEVLETVEDNMEIHIPPQPSPGFIPWLGNPNEDYLKPPYVIECDKTTGGCIGECDFPSVWHGIYPPPCRKCGKQAMPNSITYTVNTTSQ